MKEIIGLIHGILPRGSADKIKRAIRASFKRNAPLNHLHILLNCPGGSAKDALTLSAYFSKTSHPITVYLVRGLSAGAVVFLGAKNKRVTGYAEFMVHPVSFGFEDGLPNVDDFQKAFRIQRRDDRKVRALVRRHLKNITPAQWAKYRSPHGLTVGAKELLAIGVIHAAHVVPDLPDLPREAIFITSPLSTLTRY